MTILIFLLILTVLVLIHELGHFLVARKFGIKVEEFGFGFPPRAFGIKRGETIYSINWLPIGGFVKLYGEDEAGGGKVTLKRATGTYIPDLKRAFYAKPVWQRALVVVAGVVMNFLLAVFILSYIFTQGVTVPSGEVRVTEVMADSPAQTAGLIKDDIIVKVDGSDVKTADGLRKKIQPKLEEPVTLTIRRQNDVEDVRLVTKKETVDEQTVGIIGVRLNDTIVRKYSLIEAPFAGTLEALNISWLTVASLVTIPWARLTSCPAGVAGPVGVAQITGEAVQFGPMAVLTIAGFLSLNLAILNILPIPALDGGRLFFILIEMITRRRVNPHFERYTHTIGMVLVLTLAAIISFCDIARVFSGRPILPTP